MGVGSSISRTLGRCWYGIAEQDGENVIGRSVGCGLIES